MRHTTDAMYSYYAFKTFLNKLTRQGRATNGQRHTEQALKGCKLAVSAPALWTAVRAIKNLCIPMAMVRTRKGKDIRVLPVPARRNKKVTLARHRLVATAYLLPYRRTMGESLKQEILTTYMQSRSSTSLKRRNDLQELMHEHRTEMQLRWR